MTMVHCVVHDILQVKLTALPLSNTPTMVWRSSDAMRFALAKGQ